MKQRWSLGRHGWSFCGSSAVHAVVLGCAGLFGVHAAATREPEPPPSAESSFTVVVRRASAPVAEEPAEPPRGSQLAAYDEPVVEPELVPLAPELPPELFLPDEPPPDARPVDQPLARFGFEDLAFARPALGAGQGAATAGSAEGVPSGVAGAAPGGTEVGSTPGPSAGTPDGTGSAPVAARAAELLPPALLAGPDPVYPDSARRRGEEGVVLCRMHVDARGTVTAVDIEESSGHARLDEAAVERLLTWRFRPATLDGKPIAAIVRHRVRFEIAQ